MLASPPASPSARTTASAESWLGAARKGVIASKFPDSPGASPSLPSAMSAADCSSAERGSRNTRSSEATERSRTDCAVGIAPPPRKNSSLPGCTAGARGGNSEAR